MTLDYDYKVGSANVFFFCFCFLAFSSSRDPPPPPHKHDTTVPPIFVFFFLFWVFWFLCFSKGCFPRCTLASMLMLVYSQQRIINTLCTRSSKHGGCELRFRCVISLYFIIKVALCGFLVCVAFVTPSFGLVKIILITLRVSP